jgi:hypothetical protein
MLSSLNRHHADQLAVSSFFVFQLDSRKATDAHLVSVHEVKPKESVVHFSSLLSPGSEMPSVSQIAETILGAFRWPVRILCI